MSLKQILVEFYTLIDSLPSAAAIVAQIQSNSPATKLINQVLNWMAMQLNKTTKWKQIAVIKVIYFKREFLRLLLLNPHQQLRWPIQQHLISPLKDIARFSEEARKDHIWGELGNAEQNTVNVNGITLNANNSRLNDQNGSRVSDGELNRTIASIRSGDLYVSRNIRAILDKYESEMDEDYKEYVITLPDDELNEGAGGPASGELNSKTHLEIRAQIYDTPYSNSKFNNNPVNFNNNILLADTYRIFCVQALLVGAQAIGEGYIHAAKQLIDEGVQLIGPDSRVLSIKTPTKSSQNIGIVKLYNDIKACQMVYYTPKRRQALKNGYATLGTKPRNPSQIKNDQITININEPNRLVSHMNINEPNKMVSNMNSINLISQSSNASNNNSPPYFGTPLKSSQSSINQPQSAYEQVRRSDNTVVHLNQLSSIPNHSLSPNGFNQNPSFSHNNQIIINNISPINTNSNNSQPINSFQFQSNGIGNQPIITNNQPTVTNNQISSINPLNNNVFVPLTQNGNSNIIRPVPAKRPETFQSSFQQFTPTPFEQPFSYQSNDDPASSKEVFREVQLEKECNQLRLKFEKLQIHAEKLTAQLNQARASQKRRDNSIAFQTKQVSTQTDPRIPAQDNPLANNRYQLEAETLRSQLKSFKATLRQSQVVNTYLKKLIEEQSNSQQTRRVNSGLPEIKNEGQEGPKFNNYSDLLMELKPLNNDIFRRLCRASLKQKDLLIKQTDLQVGVISKITGPTQITFLLHITNVSDVQFQNIRIKPAFEALANSRQRQIGLSRAQHSQISQKPQQMHSLSYTINPSFILCLPSKEQEKIPIVLNNTEYPFIKDRPLLTLTFEKSDLEFEFILVLPLCALKFLKQSSPRENLGGKGPLSGLPVLSTKFTYSKRVLPTPKNINTYFPKAVELVNGRLYETWLSDESLPVLLSLLFDFDVKRQQLVVSCKQIPPTKEAPALNSPRSTLGSKIKNLQAAGGKQKDLFTGNQIGKQKGVDVEQIRCYLMEDIMSIVELTLRN